MRDQLLPNSIPTPAVKGRVKAREREREGERERERERDSLNKNDQDLDDKTSRLDNNGSLPTSI